MTLYAHVRSHRAAMEDQMQELVRQLGKGMPEAPAEEQRPPCGAKAEPGARSSRDPRGSGARHATAAARVAETRAAASSERA